MSGHSCPISSSWNTFCFHPSCYLLYTLPVNRGRLSNFLFINSVLSHCFLLKSFATTAAKLLLSDSLQSMDQSPSRFSLHGQEFGMGCPFLLQRILLTQGLNPCLFCLLNWQAGSLPLVPPGEIQQAETPQMSRLSRKPLPPQSFCLWRRKTLEKAGVRYLIFKLISLSY